MQFLFENFSNRLSLAIFQHEIFIHFIFNNLFRVINKPHATQWKGSFGHKWHRPIVWFKTQTHCRPSGLQQTHKFQKWKGKHSTHETVRSFKHFLYRLFAVEISEHSNYVLPSLSSLELSEQTYDHMMIWKRHGPDMNSDDRVPFILCNSIKYFFLFSHASVPLTGFLTHQNVSGT